jgi:hypothetical protein
VSDYLDSFGTSILWKHSFTRAVLDWELESLDSFLNLLYSSEIHLGETNRMLWRLGSNHGFEVKNYYESLQSGEPCSFSWISVWNVKALPHIAVFT